MDIILLENHEQLGRKGEVVSVADGYARNYLIPKEIALRKTKGNLKRFQELEKIKEVREHKEERNAKQLAEEINNTSCTIAVKAGEDDKLFGSVTSSDIAQLLEDQGIEVDKRKIQLDEPLKTLGIYNIPVKLHSNVEAKVKIWVVKE